MKIAPKNAFLSAMIDVIEKKTPLTFLFGSAFTSPDINGGIGVPNVDGILNLIKDQMEEQRLLDEYLNEIGECEGATRYNKSFEFIYTWKSPSFANSIIEEAIEIGCNAKNDEEMDYPPSLDQFAEFVKNNNVSSILTTNFDPLIEIALSTNGVQYSAYTLDTDGSIPQKVMSRKLTEIYHIHGFWKGDVTLHTEMQLKMPRESLQESLEQIIKNSTLVIMGYGGWDDIFLKSLKAVAAKKNSKIDILWCFYSDSDDDISKNNSTLFESITPAILGYKFRPYKGINCKTIFSELKSYIESKTKFPTKINTEIIKSVSDSISGLNEKKSITTNSDIKNEILIETFIDIKITHRHIRLNEQQKSQSILNANKVLAIVDKLGSGKLGFLSSVIHSNNNIYKSTVYKIDASGINNIENLHEIFKKQIGAYPAPFLSSFLSEPTCILLIDNISNLDDINWRKSLLETINTFQESKSNIQVILCGDNTLGKLPYETISLYPLDHPDFYTYLTQHENFRTDFLEATNYNQLLKMSQSLPDKIDSILEELILMTPQDYKDIIFDKTNSYKILNDDCQDESIPKRIRDFIIELSLSENKENKDCFIILMILSLMESGESFKNITKYFSRYNLKQKSFHRLRSLGLIDVRNRSILINKKIPARTSLLLFVDPIISVYVRKIMNQDHAFELSKLGLELLLGPEWMSGKIKINATVTDFLSENYEYGMGNVHSLIMTFINIAIHRNLKREIKSVYYAALSYIDYLYDLGRFDEVCSSSSEFLTACDGIESIVDVYKIKIRMGEGLRMIGMHSESNLILNELLISYPKMSNTERTGVLIDLAYIAAHKEDSDTLKVVTKEIKRLNPSKMSSSWITAHSMQLRYIDAGNKLLEMAALEKRSRKLGYELTANNIALERASLIKSSQHREELYDSIINSSKDVYTKIRASVRKARSLINNNEIYRLSVADQEFLRNAYIYSYSQRLKTLIDQCHDILWAIYSENNDISSLLNLYRHSAINWSLNGNEIMREKYTSELKKLEHCFASTELSDIFNSAIRIK
ncbi:SIR2 family protein [Pantoea agglomerans]|uniref:SIR2 family protein n=1 Tax=Enterobacter agglomerans TaxID=549 RepID=UPI003C7A9069